MSRPQLPCGLLCWVPSFPAPSVPAKWTSTTVHPEPEAQFNFHSESMTWQCTWSHAWRGAGKTELHREEGGQGRLELPCPPETTHPSGLRSTYWMTIEDRLPWSGGEVYVRWLPSDFSMGLNACNGPVCWGIVLEGTIGRKEGPFWVVDILWQAIKQLGTCPQRELQDPRLISCSLFVGSQSWSQQLAPSHSPRQYVASLQDQMQWVLWSLTKISKLLILSASLSSV